MPVRWAAAVAAALLLALLAPGRAEAGISSCSVSSTGIVFSAYDSQTKAAVDGTGTITVTCSGDGSNILSLNLSGGNTGSCSNRQMRSGGNALGYQVYQDAARTSALCDGGSRMDIVVNFGGGTSFTQTYPIYGRVPAGQNPPFGTGYSDSLTVTLKRGGGTLATTTAPITGSFAATCSVSAGTLGFGTYAPATASLASATISVNCSNGASYQVSLGGGSNQSGAQGGMPGPGGSLLSYELYSDSARTAAWGDGSALGARVSATGTGSAQSLTVYGRIPAGQSVAAGSYADSVVVTVEY